MEDMHFSTIIVEDFYSDVEHIRKMALGLDYPKPKQQTNFPGRNSAQKLLPEDLDTIVSELVQEKVVASNRDFHGHLRISLAQDDAHRGSYVHVDSSVYWAGILCLSLPEHCQGGTMFFRHKELGSDTAPLSKEEVATYGVENWWDAAEKILETDSKKTEKWEHTMEVPLRFNRLILLRPWYWHTAGPSFGDCPENGRLVQLFFFGKG